MRDKQHIVRFEMYTYALVAFFILGSEGAQGTDSIPVIKEIPNVHVKSQVHMDNLKRPGSTADQLTVEVESYFLDSFIMTLLKSESGKTFVSHNTKTGKTEYWFSGKNEVFRIYSDDGLDITLSQLTPYNYVNTAMEFLSTPGITTSSLQQSDNPSDQITIRFPADNIAQDGGALMFQRQAQLSLTDGTIQSLSLSGSMNNNVEPIFSVKGEAFHSTFVNLPQRLTFNQYMRIGNQLQKKTIAVNVTSIAPIEGKLSPPNIIAKLSKNLVKLGPNQRPADLQRVVALEEVKSSNSTSRIFMLLGTVFLLISVFLLFRRSRS